MFVFILLVLCRDHRRQPQNAKHETGKAFIHNDSSVLLTADFEPPTPPANLCALYAKGVAFLLRVKLAVHLKTAIRGLSRPEPCKSPNPPTISPPRIVFPSMRFDD